MRAYAIIAACVLVTACSAADADPGLRAAVRVEGAQFERGAIPQPDNGPEIRSARISHNAIRIGTQREQLSGALDPEASAIAIAAEGDAGYWILTAGLPRVEEPDLPAFSTSLGLSRSAAVGPFSLQLSAVDHAGRFGPREELALTAVDSEIEGELVVSLRWDTNADLDLHVIDPHGTEVWARNLNSLEPPAPGMPPADPRAWMDGGLLDIDSNAQCVIDGRDEENISWRNQPPQGQYVVRVVTASLCAQPVAHWSLEARLRGELISSARGTSTTPDTREQPGAGAGVLALMFSIP